PQISLRHLRTPSPVHRRLFFLYCHAARRPFHSFPTRRSSDLTFRWTLAFATLLLFASATHIHRRQIRLFSLEWSAILHHQRQCRSEEHTSELQSRFDLVCRLLLEKKKNKLRQ